MDSILMVNNVAELALLVRDMIDVVDLCLLLERCLLAVKVRINEGIMDGRNVDLVGDLVMLVVVLIAMVVIPVDSMGLRVQRLPWEMLAQALHDPRVKHMLVIVDAWALSCVNQAGAFRLGFHLEDEVAGLGVGVVRVEDARVRLEASACLMPATGIEVVEIVAPVELEAVCCLIPVIHLDVVVEDVPGHICSAEAMTPRVKRRRPEVHPERLRLVHVIDSSVVDMHALPHLVPIDRPADVFRRPLHLVNVPVVFRVETFGVLVALYLANAVPVDHVHGKRIGLD